MKIPKMAGGTRRLLFFLAFLGLFSASFQAGSMYQHDPEDAQILLDEFLDTIRGLDGSGIFVHNTLLALPMFIPGFGAAWGMFSGWSTGFMLAAIATVNPALSGIQPLELLFLSPFGIMELSAYSLAGSRSILLIERMARKEDIRQDTRPLLLEVVIVVALLLLGGFVEYYMIEMALQSGLTIPELQN